MSLQDLIDLFKENGLSEQDELFIYDERYQVCMTVYSLVSTDIDGKKIIAVWRPR